MATLSVTASGAPAFRTQLRAVLSSGASIRYFEFSDDGSSRLLHEQSIEPSRTASARAVSTWSPTARSDSMGIEIVLPDLRSLADFAFEVPRISVQFPATAGGIGLATPNFAFSPQCTNHVDAHCSSDASLRNKVASVGRILVERNGEPVFCTATLLNSKEPSVDALTLGDGPAPYLLTSNTCVATQQQADSMEVTWFYESGTCGSAALNHRATTTFGGGELLSTSVAEDSSLIRLRQGLPGGLVYSGWRASRLGVPKDVGTIHHPTGGVKKVSSGQANSHAGQGQLLDAIRVQWSQGAVEEGSKGAGLFADGYLVGVLSQPNQSCESGVSHFGAFEKFFPRIRGYLLGDHGDSAASATEIPVPTSIQAGLSAGDSDYFRIEITQVSRLVVYSEGDTDTKASLTRGSTVVAEASSGARADNFKIEADVTPGSYVLQVQGESNTVSGNYRLRTTLDRVGAPTAAPSNVSAERGSGHIRVAWDAVSASANEGSAITGYIAIASNTQGGGGSCDVPPIAGECVIAGLQDDLEYSVYVRATNALGEGPDSSPVLVRASATPQRAVPPALEDVRITIDQSEGRVLVEWRALPSRFRNEDLVYKAEAVSGQERLNCEAAADKLSCEIAVPDSSDGVTYSLTAYAENALGAGARSVPVRITPRYTRDHSNLWSTADVVENYSMTAASLSTAADVDWFRVDVLDAGTLYVWTSGATDTCVLWSDGASCASSAYLRTEGEDRRFDGGGDDRGRGRNFWHYENLPPGTYYFAVGGAVGDYTLHVELVEDDHGNSYRDGTLVGTDSETPSHLAWGDVDWFRVDVLDAGTLYVWTSGATDTCVLWSDGASCASSYAYLRTEGEDRRFDGGGDDRGRGRNFWHYENLPPGTYYFAVGGAVGDYTLHVELVEDDHGNSYRDGTLVGTDSETPSHLAWGDVDWFRVDVLDAGTLYVWTSGATDTCVLWSDGASCASSYAYLRTEGEDRWFDGGGDDRGRGRNFWHYENLPPGTYYFAVGGRGSGRVWPYTLVVDFAACDIDALTGNQKCELPQ